MHLWRTKGVTLKNVLGVCGDAIGNPGNSINQQREFRRKVCIMGMNVAEVGHFTNDAASLAKHGQRVDFPFGANAAKCVSQRSPPVPPVSSAYVHLAQKYSKRLM